MKQKQGGLLASLFLQMKEERKEVHGRQKRHDKNNLSKSVESEIAET